MAFFEWSPEYNTGHDTIDIQHLNLMGYINRLHDAESTPPEVSHFVIQLILESLIEYTIYHFQTEEELMKKSEYPDYENHRKEHESMKATVANMLAKLSSGEVSAHQVIEFVKLWIINHICKTDKRLAAHLIERDIVR